MTIYRTEEGQRAIRRWCESRLAAWPVAHETRTIGTSLGPTHVVTSGAGDPLVLLAGTNFGAATWLDLVEMLSADHTVHAVDLPGQPGLSVAVRPKSGRQRYGAWLTEVLPLIGAEHARVVANSLGAVVALTAAAGGAPISSLVLLAPAGLMRLRVSVSVLRPTLPWLRAPNASTSAALLRMMMAPNGTPDPTLTEWMTLVGRHVRTSLAPAPLPTAELRRLYRTPVAVLSGRHDAFLPPSRLERSTRRRLAPANFEIIEGAGHLLPHERSDAVLGHLDRSKTSGPG